MPNFQTTEQLHSLTRLCDEPVMNIFPFNDKHNLNMFDLRYQLRLNDLYDLTATNVLYYEMAQQHIRLLDNILVGRQPIRFNQHMNRLYLDMDVDMINANEFLIIECYRKLDPTDFTDIYNDMWLKKYATALCKYQWGENLSKFQGIQLPVVGDTRCQQLKQEAQEEIQRLEEESRLNHDMLPGHDWIMICQQMFFSTICSLNRTTTIRRFSS